MAFSRVVLLWIHLSLSLASRGDEPNDLVHSAPQSSKLWEAFSATHDWLHVTGPSTVVKAMSQRGQLCSIFIFGLATFCMLRQIYMSFQSLLQGLQQVKKMEEEAPAPMSPATFLAAANEDALRQQRGRAADGSTGSGPTPQERKRQSHGHDRREAMPQRVRSFP
eukprot:CAMPEP_0114688728 /NCGR_PEP_ID=MMETSP0191-20121206/63786_1 /TAXON_ID=126664 /ORGANISM="Sorites sp." /LENGTH=164 /DNA_ID=CAMNT_0001976537 /DNA_START=62 /DNA_END=553 /DNA_ORIENTATION=+